MSLNRLILLKDQINYFKRLKIFFSILFFYLVNPDRNVDNRVVFFNYLQLNIWIGKDKVVLYYYLITPKNH